MAGNELPHSHPSLRLSQDFPPVLHSPSERVAVGSLMFQFDSLVMLFFFLSFSLTTAVMFCCASICGSDRTRDWTLFCCCSLQCFLVLTKVACLALCTHFCRENKHKQTTDSNGGDSPTVPCHFCVFALVCLQESRCCCYQEVRKAQSVWLSHGEYYSSDVLNLAHQLQAVTYSQKPITLQDKNLETHFLLSLLMCSHVLSFLTTGFLEGSCAFAKPFLAETWMPQPCAESASWKLSGL